MNSRGFNPVTLDPIRMFFVPESDLKLTPRTGSGSALYASGSSALMMAWDARHVEKSRPVCIPNSKLVTPGAAHKPRHLGFFVRQIKYLEG